MMASRLRLQLLIIFVTALREATCRPVVYIHESSLRTNSSVLCIAEIDTPEYKAAFEMDEKGRARFFFDSEGHPSMPVTVYCQRNDGTIVASSNETLSTRLRAPTLCPDADFHAGFFSGAGAEYRSECSATRPQYRLPCCSPSHHSIDDEAQHAAAATATAATAATEAPTKTAAGGMCSKGLLSESRTGDGSAICCAVECGSCSAHPDHGCGHRPGGAANCCAPTILAGKKECKKDGHIGCIVKKERLGDDSRRRMSDAPNDERQQQQQQQQRRVRSSPTTTTGTSWIQIIGDSVIGAMYCRWRFELYGRTHPFKCDRKANEAFTRSGSVVISFHRMPGTGGNAAKNFADELKMSLEGPNKYHMQWWVDITSATFEELFQKPISSFETGKRPARTFFTIGCHYASWSIRDWLSASSAIFRGLVDVDSHPDRWIYMLNVPPLTSLIPARYREQRTTRTMLVNYWKNRQVLLAAKAHGNLISMADFATSELYWNERGGHVDAVHVVNNVSTDVFPKQQVLTAMFSEMCEPSY